MKKSQQSPQQPRAIRLKKIAFRATHRGIREMDILLGNFIQQRLAKMTETELDQFEAMLTLPDQDFLKILKQDASIPAAHNHPLMQALIAFTQRTPNSSQNGAQKGAQKGGTKKGEVKLTSPQSENPLAKP